MQWLREAICRNQPTWDNFNATLFPAGVPSMVGFTGYFESNVLGSILYVLLSSPKSNGRAKWGRAGVRWYWH